MSIYWGGTAASMGHQICSARTRSKYRHRGGRQSRVTVSSVEQTEAHVVIRLLGLFLLGLGSSSRRGRGGGRSRSSSHSELGRIGEVLLHLLSLLEGDVGLGGDGEQVLESVDDGVRRRGGSGHADLQRYAGHVADAAAEGSQD